MSDAVLTNTATIDLARQAIEDIALPGTVGEHVGYDEVEQRVGTHYFASLLPGYHQWRWAATVARVPRAKKATVSETNLLPGAGALLSPDWVPYADRLAPGDLGPGDILPYVADDPYLEAGFEATGDEEVDQMAQWELGLGRIRVLSGEGREAAATRWNEGERGPRDAAKAPEACSSCGFFLPLPGVLRRSFGVCANGWSPADGTVVALDYGCGAHSEVDLPTPTPDRVPPPILDDNWLDVSPAST
ncbi:MAG: DUF3027 domain-containing protein [Nostocoides sp.]